MGIELEDQIQIQFKIRQAEDFVSQGKLLHALQIYESIINKDPHFFEAYTGMAEVYEHLGNVQNAVNLLSSFLENEPDNRDARLYLGQFLLRNSLWEEAIEVLSLILPEEEAHVSFFLGFAHFMLTDLELARINFLSFISSPEKSELYYEANLYLAKIETVLLNFQQAIEYAKIAEVMYNNYWELNAIYANIYYNLDMHAHAVNPIEKAIKLNPTESELYGLAGRIYFKLGDFFKAEKNFLKLVESSEEVSSDAYASLAEACLKGNKLKDAEAYFDLALKLDPENKNASYGKNFLSAVLNNNIVTDA